MFADILIVDDEEDIRTLLSDILEDEGYHARTANDADSAFAAINHRQPSLIILDIWLQSSRKDGIEILKVVKRDNPGIPVVIISGHGSVEIAVAAIQQGAYDFIEKPFKTSQFLLIVERALETFRLRRENATLKATAAAEPELVGESQPMQSFRNALDRVAQTGSRVLISGPSGAGKEVAAHYLHRHSQRADFPFVSVPASAIEPERMEEVLFGVEREGGLAQPGLLEQAHGGTLFFDEIADLTEGAQAKLLRVLVDQTFSRVGSSNPSEADVRIVSATGKDLGKEIAVGNFREDLFHRLSVVPLEVPPLVQRREDIPALVSYFQEKLNEEENLPIREISEDALMALQTYDWPGNIRQLRNVVERLMIIGAADGSGMIGADDLPPEIISSSSSVLINSGGESLVSLPLREAREAFERDYLIAQINRFSGNVSRTAAFIGMERSALHRKLKALGVVTCGRGGVRVAYMSETQQVAE